MGSSLLVPISALTEWAVANQSAIEAARAEFDKRRDEIAAVAT